MSAYAQEGGVDNRKIGSFKKRIAEAGKMTLDLPRWLGITVRSRAHGAGWSYDGHTIGPVENLEFIQTTEGLGNLSWVGDWLSTLSERRHNYVEGGLYRSVAIHALRMATNDGAAQGAMPFLYTDEVAAGDSDWFQTPQAEHLIEGLVTGCCIDNIALPAGESPALKYLVNSLPPVESSPTLSGTVQCVVPQEFLISDAPETIEPGLAVVAFSSSGVHANGVSLVINRVMDLPKKFDTQIADDSPQTIGEALMAPTLSYVNLVHHIVWERKIPIRRFLPGTGGGLAKLTRLGNFTFELFSWQPLSRVFRFILEKCGLSMFECATTFNLGAGYYALVEDRYVEDVIAAATACHCRAWRAGVVKNGPTLVVPPAHFNCPPLPPPDE